MYSVTSTFIYTRFEHTFLLCSAGLNVAVTLMALLAENKEILVCTEEGPSGVSSHKFKMLLASGINLLVKSILSNRQVMSDMNMNFNETNRIIVYYTIRKIGHAQFCRIGCTDTDEAIFYRSRQVYTAARGAYEHVLALSSYFFMA